MLHHAHVHLQAYHVYRHTTFSQIAHQRIDCVGLSSQTLTAVVVVEQLCLRVCFVRSPECHLSILGPNASQPYAIPERAIVVHRFVHDVPRGDPTAVVLNHRRNMLPEDCLQLIARIVPLSQPTKESLMPNQRMASYPHIVRLCEVHYCVRIAEVVQVSTRSQSVELHCILRGQDLKLISKGLSIKLIVTQWLDSHGRTKLHAGVHRLRGGSVLHVACYRNARFFVRRPNGDDRGWGGAPR